MSAAQGTTVVDDERVRITTWTFAADGDTIGSHVHGHDVANVSGAPAAFVEIELKR
jgi:hypothetical protein